MTQTCIDPGGTWTAQRSCSTTTPSWGPTPRWSPAPSSSSSVRAARMTRPTFAIAANAAADAAIGAGNLHTSGVGRTAGERGWAAAAAAVRRDGL